MIVKQITKYAEGRMTEEEAMELWIHLLQHPDDLALLKTYMMYREWYRQKMKKGKGGYGNTEGTEG